MDFEFEGWHTAWLSQNYSTDDFWKTRHSSTNLIQEETHILKITHWCYRGILRKKNHRLVWLAHLFPWKPLGSSKSNGDSRIEMGTRDVTNRVNHDHHNKSPNNCNSWKRHRLVCVQIHHHRPTTSKYQEVCPQHLSNHLKIKRFQLSSTSNIWNGFETERAHF